MAVARCVVGVFCFVARWEGFERMTKNDSDVLNSLVGGLPRRFGEHGPFKDMLREFVAYRREIKKPLTARAAKIFVNAWSSHHPDDVREALERSILNTWRGVFVKPNELRDRDADDAMTVFRTKFEEEDERNRRVVGFTSYSDPPGRFYEEFWAPVEKITHLQDNPVTKAACLFALYMDVCGLWERVPEGLMSRVYSPRDLVSGYLAWVAKQEWLSVPAALLFDHKGFPFRRFLQKERKNNLDYCPLSGRYHGD